MSDYHPYEDDADDKTQPTSDIIDALRDLENSSQQPSEYDTLMNQLREKPMQPDLWARAVAIAEAEADLGKIEATYEALLENYPDTPSAQIAYLSHYMSPELFKTSCQGLFNRFLRTNPPPQSIDLWRYYLDTVRRSNPDSSQRDAIQQCFDFTISKVGHDVDSGSIWHDYIQFIKEGKCNSEWEEQRKRDALRKVYHRAVQIPLDNVEKLWSELETFETSMNKITAKKFMADLSPAHMQARTVLRQLQKHLTPLNLPPSALPPRTPPVLHLATPPTFTPQDRSLIGAWKAYLKWEEGNPLEIEEKDKQLLVTRVQGVYKKALSRMRFYSEIWYMAYTWTNTHGKAEDAKKLLEEGLKANPKSFLLTFALAELQELRKEYTEVRNIYERLLESLRKDLEDAEIHLKSANNSQSTDGGEPSQHNQQSGSLSSFNSQDPPRIKDKEQEFKAKRAEYGLVWIMFMRFARRAEGVAASRVLFANARKQRLTPWNVYEAGALMEYHGSIEGDTSTQQLFSKLGVATRIFERGMDAFGDEPEYVQRYLNFLISVNDEKNARALFERIIGSFTPEQARPLWERWARYEYQYGDLEASLKLEQRMAEVYPADPPIKRFAQRHTYPGTDAIAARDLGWVIARQTQFPSMNGSGSSGNLSAPAPIGGSASNVKRGNSPTEQPRTKRESTDYGPSHSMSKRARPSSPAPRDRDRDRDRDRGDRGRERWDHGRRGASPPPPRRYDREEEKLVNLPSVLSKFIGQLPAPATFDGPVFRTDDLMNLFRSAVIPASNSTPARVRSPPPPARGKAVVSYDQLPISSPTSASRPPPDYGPYQGPGGGGRRRY